MDSSIVITHGEIIQNLKINLDLVEAFFKYLPYSKKSELKLSMTYYSQNTLTFKRVVEIVSEVERCIQYQSDKKMKIDIPVEIVFSQDLFFNDKIVSLYYGGQLNVFGKSGRIFWNMFQNHPAVEFQLDESLPPKLILSLFENFQTTINDFKLKDE